MPQNNFEVLGKILSRTIAWVKYAEAKNGALIAVECGILLGIYKIIDKPNELNGFLQIYLYINTFLIVLSLAVLLYSFMPRLKPPFWLSPAAIEKTDNLLFFGHACKYNKDNYLRSIIEKYEISGEASTNLDLDICDQIVINSQIAYNKFSIFKIAFWIFICALFTPLAALIIWFLSD